MSNPKEVSFFQDSMDFKPNPNYEKGWAWYQQAFLHYAGESLVGDATPSYSDRSRSPLTAGRIYKFNPEMKLIYMVRDPLQRQISAWKMQWAFGISKASNWRRETQWALEGFDAWLEKQRDAKQWDVCRYSFQLQAYRDYFSEDQILISFLEEWKTNKMAEVSRIMEFLGLDPTLWDSSVEESANRAADRSIERNWYSRLRKQRLVKFVSAYLPRFLKQKASQKIGRVSASPPPIDLESSVVQEFMKYVQKDLIQDEPFKTTGQSLWKIKDSVKP
jgi:hypothetical protein